MILSILLLVVGLIVLILGGELLVRGAAGLAGLLRIPPLIVGLTIVAFCTSAPELAVSLRSALAGETQLAVGNVVGSNICNILLVLGLSAVVTPLVVDAKLIRWEVPVMIAVSLLFYWFCRNGQLGRFQGVALFAVLLGYMTWTVFQARRERKDIQTELVERAAPVALAPQGWKSTVLFGVFLVGGLGLLVLGADWMVRSAVDIAERLGISQLVIGLTVLAIGTSLPELAVSGIAALQGKRELAVGNVIGSNLFNILCVLGLTAAVAPSPVLVPQAALTFDIPIMIGVSVACLPFFLTGAKLDRREGGVFLLFYVAYIGCLASEAVAPSMSKTLELWVFGVAGPLVLLVAFWVAYRAWRRNPGDANP